MRPRILLLFFVFFLFVASVSADRPIIRPVIPPTSLPVVVDSYADIIPLSISAKKPLRDIQVSYSAAESVRADQREKYAQLNERLLRSSDSERPLLTAQISQQRQRVLLSTLNSMILIYQRADYLVEKFSVGILSMRSKYSSSNPRLATFDSRIRALESSLASLKQESKSISRELTSASSSIQLSQDLVSLKGDLSSFLNDLKSFSTDYRALAQDVVSRE